MWNALQERHDFSLLCAYAMSGFDRPSDVRDVCAEHDEVSSAPRKGTESGIRLADADSARAVAAELAHHSRMEGILRESLRDLRDTGDALRAKQRDTERIVRVTAAIADAVTTDQVYEAIVDLAGAAVGASSSALWLRDGDEARAKLVRASGYSEASLARFGAVVFDDADRFPALDAMARAEPVYVSTQEELLSLYPHLATDVTRGRDYRIACLPIIVDGRTLGGLAFTFEHAPPIDDDQRRFLTLAARYSGQAIERLRLLAAERSRRSRAEAAAARMSILNRATRLFSEASTDLATLLAAVAEQIAVEAADACAVALFSDGEAPRLSAAYPSGHRIRAVAESLSGGELYSADARLCVVPLVVRGKQIGAVVAERDPSRGAMGDQERALVAELSERAAVVVDRTLLYDASRRARQRAELLYGLARVVIGAERIEQVLDAALDAIERAVGATRSAVLVADVDGIMRFKAWRGLSDEYRAAVEGHSPWPRDARAPEPILVPDVRLAPALAPLLPVVEKEGILALSFIPLLAESELLGKFMVYYAEPHELTPQELEVASAIANHVASAIARLSAVSELRQTVRFNEMFTAILGHDLRNPLGAIMTAAQLAMKRHDDERLRKPLGRILNSGQRMARMIDQLLDFTRVRVGSGLPLAPKPLDVLPLLRQILDELEDANPGFALSMEALGDTVGEWDADRLGQVFSNLVGNAVQHGDSANGVRIRVDGSDPQVVGVDVVNGGVIPRDLVGKLFEPMTGGEGKREKSQGLGLGLFITKQIVRAHGGTIDVRSSESGGTAFRVVLPRFAVRPPGAA
jgi:K+-sensing histidine kinase KdpD